MTDELLHFGIPGQRWGKKNGPPYPLSRAEHRAVVRSAKAAKRRGLSYDSAKRNARKLTDDDLDLALERLRREKEYAYLLSDGKREGQSNSQNQNESFQSKKPSIAGKIVGDIAATALKKLALGLVSNYIGDKNARLKDIRESEKKAALELKAKLKNDEHIKDLMTMGYTLTEDKDKTGMWLKPKAAGAEPLNSFIFNDYNPKTRYDQVVSNEIRRSTRNGIKILNDVDLSTPLETIKGDVKKMYYTQVSPDQHFTPRRHNS